MSGREHRSRYSRFQSERFQGKRHVRFHQSSHGSRNRSPYPERAHQWSQGTRHQRSHSEKGRQSSQGGRARSRSAYTERWDDHRGQRQYRHRDTGRYASSRDRRQQEERRDQWTYSRPQQQRDRVRRPFSGKRSGSQHQRKKRDSTSANREQSRHMGAQSSKVTRGASQPRPESPPSRRFVVVTPSPVPAVSQETVQVTVSARPSTREPEPQLVPAEQETSLPTGVVGMQQRTVEPETSKSDGKRHCPLCHKAVDHLRRHVEQHHLPWYFCPERVCWQCRSSSDSLKQLWRTHGNCQDGAFNNHWLEVWVATMWGWLDLASQYTHCSGVKGLLELFLERKWYAQEAGFCPSATRELLLNQIQNVYGDAGLEVRLRPPNCPSAVLTWFGCLRMLQELQEEDRDSLLLYQLRESPAERRPIAYLTAGDGHFHFESVVQKPGPLTKLFVVGATATDPEVKVDLAIWNCVFPGTWYNNPAIQTIAELRRTYGAHPRLATETLPWGKLQQLFDSKECQGIGECGLDETAEDLKAQEKIFLVQVRAAQRTGKPLVLHIRAKAEDTGPLHAQVRQLVAAILEKRHRVYLHCFVGSWKTYMEWTQAFPNLLLGFSKLTVQHKEFQKLCRSLPFHQLALESDSAHLGHSPVQLLEQAAAVAECRNLPMAVVLAGTRRNVDRFYSPQ